ncbi:CPSF A subunit region [Colletotrichum lupini]|uniref:DNA damage-binding protein 1 n=1 Tax=Colletotrichum lupini TaxID=145971 RepID=A0A9Q8SGT0_9PEZI|nr:CPSF A subunit region [Colletotrichum lupini]UQC76631.1 CPSF A subunit region [Colletotrichum lupini]
MPIEIQPVLESDLRRCAEIEKLAFSGSPLDPVLFPGPMPEDIMGIRAEELAKQFREDTTVRFHKAVDTELSGDEAIIAWSKWNAYSEGLPVPKPRVWGPGCNEEACNKLFHGLDEMRQRLMGGKKVVYLHILVTDPKHQRRGAGWQLMTPIVQEAVRLGVPAYLESSRAGHHLYQKVGFKDIDEYLIDFSQYGLEQPHINWAMLWELPNRRLRCSTAVTDSGRSGGMWPLHLRAAEAHGPTSLSLSALELMMKSNLPFTAALEGPGPALLNSDTGTMSYIAPIHRPSSIRQAIRIRLSEEDESESLVVALEVWRITPTDMYLLGSAAVYGTILLLQRLRPRDSKADLLFVGTDRFQYFTARWDSATQRLHTEQVVEDTAEPHMREAQSQDKCLVDPTGRFMAMHLWEGVMNVMRLGTRKGQLARLDDAWEQVRLSELFMKASIFVPTETGHPTVAFLYQSKIDKEDARLAIYRLMTDDKNTAVSRFDPERNRDLDIEIKDPYARILIPVNIIEDEVKRYHKRDTSAAKAQLGGLIVVGETLLVYVDTLTQSVVESPMASPAIFVAWAAYDDTNFFLSDDYGNLHLLTIETEGVVVLGMTVRTLGVTSRASCLVYMGDGMLFLGSHYGDSQLLQVDLEELSTKLVQTIPNIAPILDFAIMDLGNAGDSQIGNAFSSGQARIVAGCGVHQNGSLRSIRSSVGLEDIGVLEDLQDARGLFSLQSHGSEKVDTLVVSFMTETRVFSFDAEGGIEEVFEFHGLNLDQPTLIAKTLPSGQLLQVTAAIVTLLDLESGVTLNSWSVPDGKTIVNASANSKRVLLSINGTSLVSLNLVDNLAAQEQVLGRGVGGEEDQISCVHAASDLDHVGVVGFWATGSVSIIDLRTLNALQGETIKQTDDSVSVPRDMVLVQLHPPHLLGPTLFVAMEDGQVVSFNVSKDDFSLSSRKSVTLGSKQAGLHVLPRPDDEGISNVFATTEHSSLIYSSEGRIIYSAATAEDVTYIAPFDSEAFPDAIFLATDRNVRIAHIDAERRTHVNPLPLRETVRRVAYSPALRAFGIGTIRRELINNEEAVSSSFQLVDEVVLGVVGKAFHLDGSTSAEMVESVIRAELPDSMGQPAERFIIGTSYLADPDVDENSDIKGRILVLGVDSDKNPYLIVSHALKGACRSLGVMGDKIVAGLSKTVVVYDYAEESSTSGALRKLATFRPSTFPVDIDVNGNMIGVADLMQSMTLVEFIPAQDGDKAKLVERARHFQYIWATSVCHLEEHSWLESDAQGNLMVLRRNPNAPTEHDQKQMEVISEFHLGEQVNKIRSLDIVPNENDPIVPKAFLATVEGSVYVFADIRPEHQSLLLQFQENLAGVVKTLGQADNAPGAGLSFMSWRGFRNAKRAADAPFRFVDGELIERFLDLDEAKQEAVVAGLGPTVENMRNLVEELKRMH